MNRVDLKGGSSGGSSHDGSSSSHHSTSDLISQFVDGQYLTTEVGIIVTALVISSVSLWMGNISPQR